MNDLQLEREIRATLQRRVADVMDPQAVPSERPVLRDTRRRQLATVVTVVATCVALVAMSVMGVGALLRSSEPGVPAAPPEVPVPPSVQRATVTWDGETCTYAGPLTAIADQEIATSARQGLRITFEDRSNSDSVALVVMQLPNDANYQEFIEWSKTHEVNYYGDFPPERFLGPGDIVGSGQLEDGKAWIGPFDQAGRYFVACLAWPPDEGGGTLHHAALLQVTEGS